MLPVLNLLPKAGLPEATLATQDASPEQSVPAGVSPPGMYGVPDTCAISDINAARANIRTTLTELIARTQRQHLSKAVAPITIRAIMWSRTLNFLRCNNMEIHCVRAAQDSFWQDVMSSPGLGPATIPIFGIVT